MASLTCIAGREVVIRLRHRKTGFSRTASVVCPARWTKARLLEYVRRCHPNESVRIEEWKPKGPSGDPWETRLWIVNPIEMQQN